MAQKDNRTKRLAELHAANAASAASAASADGDTFSTDVATDNRTDKTKGASNTKATKASLRQPTPLRRQILARKEAAAATGSKRAAEAQSQTATTAAKAAAKAARGRGPLRGGPARRRSKSVERATDQEAAEFELTRKFSWGGSSLQRNPSAVSASGSKVSGWGVYCCDFLLLPVVS